MLAGCLVGHGAGLHGRHTVPGAWVGDDVREHHAVELAARGLHNATLPGEHRGRGDGPSAVAGSLLGGDETRAARTGRGLLPALVLLLPSPAWRVPDNTMSRGSRADAQAEQLLGEGQTRAGGKALSQGRGHGGQTTYLNSAASTKKPTMSTRMTQMTIAMTTPLETWF